MTRPVPTRQNRDRNVVKIQNIPQQVDRHEVISLFSTLIGDIRDWWAVSGSPGSCLELSFATPDAARKALFMSGYALGGSHLVVSAVGEAHPDGIARAKVQDGRRNLYVLGIPYDTTKADLTHLFSRFGTVAHCVVLATVDNASRRRGFVVMSSNEEASKALKALTRTQVKGHVIDVSWAIVQRSQGFLDGGDRNVLQDSDTQQNISSDADEAFNASRPVESPATLCTDPSPTLSDMLPSLLPSAVIRVSNLPSMLFSQDSDLHPLLMPFGEIKSLNVRPSPSQDSTSIVLVEYATVHSAKEARETIAGQSYAGHDLQVTYLWTPEQVPRRTAYDVRNESHPPFQDRTNTPSYVDSPAYFSRPHPQPYYRKRCLPQLPNFSPVPCYSRASLSRTNSSGSRWSDDSGFSNQYDFYGPVANHTFSSPAGAFCY